VDGDSHLDLVTANQAGTISVLRNDGAGGFVPAGPDTEALGAVYHGKPGYPIDLVLADVDNDGDLDVVTADIGQAEDYNSLISTLPPLTNVHGPSHPPPAPFGQAQFPLAVSADTTAGEARIKAADLNGDGALDIIVVFDTMVAVLLSGA